MQGDFLFIIPFEYMTNKEPLDKTYAVMFH